MMDCIKSSQWSIPSIGLALFILLLLVIPQRIGLYTIGKRRQIKSIWLTWLPFGDFYMLGSISDQYQDIVRGRKTIRRFLLPVLSLLGGIPLVALLICLCGVLFYLYVAVMSLGLIDLTQTLDPEILQQMTILTVPIGLLMVCTIWGTILHYMALHDLFSAASPVLSKGSLIINILFPVLEPYYILLWRNKDQGMPQSIPNGSNSPTENTSPPRRRTLEKPLSNKPAFDKRKIGVIIFWCVFLVAFIIPVIIYARNLGWLTPVILTLAIEIPYILLIKNLGFVKTKSKVIIERALADGTYSTARRTGQWGSYSTYRSAKERKENGSMSRTEYWAIYEYQVDGRLYTQKRRGFQKDPPVEMTFYYPAGNPQKAIAYDNEIPGLRYYLLTAGVPVFIALLVFCITGILNISNLIH